MECARAVVAALVVLALILPTVAQALPSPTLTPEQALLRDLATSICSQDGRNGGGNQDQHSPDKHDCKLCILCCAPSIIAMVEGSNQFTVASVGTGQPDTPLHRWHVPVNHPLADETGPPRGPPSFS